MGDIWQESKLILFIAFFIPGFVAMQSYDLFSPSKPREASSTILQAIMYSCFNYALLSWLIYLDWYFDVPRSHPAWHAVVLVFTLLVFPALFGAGIYRLRRSGRLARHIPYPSPKPWDYVFGNRKTYWVIIEMTDGKRIGGVYDKESYASGFPNDEQLYLQQLWELNGRQFVRAVERSKGGIVSGKDIRWIEFFK